MVTFSPTQWIQLVAVATIPLMILGIVASRMARRQQLKQKHFRQMFILSSVPALVALGLQGALSPWVIAVMFVAVVAFALLTRQRE